MKIRIWLGILFAASVVGCATDDTVSTSTTTTGSEAPGLTFVVEQDLKGLEYWVMRYRLDTARLPTDLNALTTSDGSDRWRGPYVTDPNALIDLWGNKYLLEATGSRFTLRSKGPDRQPGTGDDIVLYGQ